MKLEYLFTVSRKNKIGSKLIAKTTHMIHPELKECSHVAIKMGPIIFESTLTSGVKILPYNNWIKEQEIVYAFESKEHVKAKDIINKVISRFYGKSYDWKGIFYFAIKLIQFMLFKTPLPTKNIWESKNRFFCVELIGSITGEKYGMTSPIQLVKMWKDQGVADISSTYL